MPTPQIHHNFPLKQLFISLKLLNHDLDQIVGALSELESSLVNSLDDVLDFLGLLDF